MEVFHSGIAGKVNRCHGRFGNGVVHGICNRKRVSVTVDGTIITEPGVLCEIIIVGDHGLTVAKVNVRGKLCIGIPVFLHDFSEGFPVGSRCKKIVTFSILRKSFCAWII